MTEEDPPVVVVGAGPVGLAAAAELVERGVPVVVFERGTRAGAAVAQWHHVRLFSRWAELVAPAARRLLAPLGWQLPDADTYPSGAEWVESYLRPLADALGDRVRFGTEVVGVARRGRDRVVDAGRATEPLTVHVRGTVDDKGMGAEERVTARAVVDASGTWGSPNPLGADGLPALGEAAAADRIAYRVPDLADAEVAARYAGRHVVVAGAGHSALTALVAFAALAERHPSTRLTWLLRRGTVGTVGTRISDQVAEPVVPHHEGRLEASTDLGVGEPGAPVAAMQVLAGAVFGSGEDDRLPARGALGVRAEAAVAAGHIRVVSGFRTEAVRRDRHGLLTLVSADGARVDGVDEVVALTGFRPDLSWLSEVRLALDPTLQAPIALAPLIDPNVHSCTTVHPQGVKELAQPEPGVFLAGMKSYGRAPTFLAMTGYEQVRSIAADLAGDRASAEQVERALPETGLFHQGASGGCRDAPGPRDLTLSVPPGR